MRVPNRPTSYSRAANFLKVAVSLGILAYLAGNINMRVIANTLRVLDVKMLGLCLIQMLLIPLLGALRWKIVLTRLDYRRPLGSLVRMFWIGMAFNQILPTAVGGDALRGWLIFKSGVMIRDATISILIERIVLLVSLLAIVAVEGWLGASLGPGSIYKIAAFGLGISSVAALLFPFGRLLLARLPAGPFARRSVNIWEAFAKVVLDRRVVLLMALCALTNLNLAIAGWWLGLALGMPYSLSLYLVAIPIATLAAVVPISLGGWGVREAMTIAVLGPIIGKDQAFLYSIAFGMAILLSSLPGFLLSLYSSRGASKSQKDPSL